MTTYPVRTRRWTRKEYDRLVEIGMLHEDEPIELIGGELIVAEPKGSPHATAVALAADALRAAFGRGWLVRRQDPIALDDDSEPEILNLVDRVVEVRRRPAPAPSAKFGWRYADVKLVREGGTVSPLARPDIPIAVADLLP